MTRRLLRLALLVIAVYAIIYAIAYGIEHWPNPGNGYHVEPGPVPIHFQRPQQ
jgi:hypothetical protein